MSQQLLQYCVTLIVFETENPLTMYFIKKALSPNEMQLCMQYIAYTVYTAMKKWFCYQNILEVCTNILMVIKL